MAHDGRLLNYEELLAQYPDWDLWRTSDYYKEFTPEATEAARLRKLKRTGDVVKFIQDTGLTRLLLCQTAPDSPEDFCVYLRYMHADPADVHVMGESARTVAQDQFCWLAE